MWLKKCDKKMKLKNSIKNVIKKWDKVAIKIVIRCEKYNKNAKMCVYVCVVCVLGVWCVCVCDKNGIDKDVMEIW